MEPNPSLVPEECTGLVQKIDAGECVLVLGPRVALPAAICEDGRTAIADHLSRKLLTKIGETDKAGISLREVLEMFERREGAASLRSSYRGFYASLDAHTTQLHRDLASLPFRLVVMSTPDRMMFNAMRDTPGKQAVIEGYYDYGNAAAGAGMLALPTSSRPIIYSLFGRHDHPESMVLTDKNLLDYLVRLTRESPALPDPVRATLRAPSTLFLFVGFGFSNWWLRLLLKVLCITGVENRELSLALEDPESFAASTTFENRGFFASAGIYIHSGNWNELAAELAQRYQKTRPAEAPAVASASPTAPATPAEADVTPTGDAPLVFLSYASEDRDFVDLLRRGLQENGVSVFQDAQGLRAGNFWRDKLADYIFRVDYFLFIQTPNMDARGEGVFNEELKTAIRRTANFPGGREFLVHVVAGDCQPREEPELAATHQFRYDESSNGVDKLAAAILESFAARKATRRRAAAG